MGLFGGKSKAAKELERKKQQERDEENAKRADEPCAEQTEKYQRKQDLPPNVLRVTVIRAKELLAVDKKLWGSGGASADPFPCMEVEGHTCKGDVKKQNLTPVWLDRFELPCEDGDSYLTFEVQDHDTFGAGDFMGCCKLQLKTLRDEKPHRAWHKLGNAKGELDDEKRGRVELCVRWCHDKARAYDLPKEFKAGEKAGAKSMPNELHVYLVRARDLEVMDKGLLGAKGSSDPIVTFDVMGAKQKATQKKKDLNPVWQELFTFVVEDEDAMLEVTMEDHDLTGNSFMGRCCVPLKTLGDRKIHRGWQRLLGPKTKKRRSAEEAGKKRGRLDLACRWVHNATLVVPLPPELQASELHFDRPANEVQIFLVRASGLPIMDRNLMSAGGSSDPLVTFTCCGETCVSSIQKKNLNPQWEEYFSLLVEEGDAVLSIVVEDHDLMGNDFMGQIALPVKALEDRRVDRRWHVLQPRDPQQRKKKEDEKKDIKLGKLKLAVRWKHNPDRVIQLPEEFAKDDFPTEPPNYVQICLVRARRLQVMDKSRLSAGGSSDPLVIFSLDGEAVTSSTKPKCLRPVWSEYFELPIEDADQILYLKMEDYDAFGTNDTMGLAQVDMEGLGDRITRRQWLELQDPEGKDAGAVEIALRWAHDPQRVLALPAEFLVDEDPENLVKEANELLVCLLRGKNLPVMDKNLLSSGGSSDPCALLNLDGEIRKSKVLKKTVNPLWMQTFRFPCDDGLNITLQVDIEDYDLKGNDFMGQCGVYLGDLHEVEERRVERVWYALAPPGMKTKRKNKQEEPPKRVSRASGGRRTKGAKKKEKRRSIEEEPTVVKGPNIGRVEFALRWVHNPELVVTLPDTIVREEAHPEEPANSLLITLVRARNLPVMDTGVFGGSSDPVCIIKVEGESVKSTVRKKDLNPVWVESFELPNADKDARVVVEVLDYDAYGSSDPIGSFSLPFLALADRKLMRRWFVLKDQAGQKTGGKCEVALKWQHNPDFSMELPYDMEGSDDLLDMPSNQLRICLMRARELPVMDVAEGLASGSSDPFATLIVEPIHKDDVRGEAPTILKSTTKVASLRPVWMERFDVPVDDAGEKELTISLYDDDFDDSDPELIGRVKVPLKRALQRKKLATWHELYNPERAARLAMENSRNRRASDDSLEEDTTPTDTKTGEVEICLRLVYNPKCRVPYYDLTDAQDLETISNICVDAVENGRDEPLKLLVVRCATCSHVLVDEHRGVTPAMVACSRDEDASLTFKLLRRLDCDLDAKDRAGRTAAHVAARCGNDRALRCLAELDASLLSEDAYGKQPCHYASEAGNDSTVERLIKLGADPEDQTHNGRSCCALAAQNGRASTVKLLHDLGADIDEAGTMFGGRRPLHFACAAGDHDTVRMLLRLGADADGVDNMQNGPAHCAALEGRRDIVNLLGEYDCDLDAANDDGFTPADLLAQHAAKDSGGAATQAVDWAIEAAEPAPKPVDPA